MSRRRVGSLVLQRLWQVYIDDFDRLEICEWDGLRPLLNAKERSLSPAAMVARRQFKLFGVPRSLWKATATSRGRSHVACVGGCT